MSALAASAALAGCGASAQSPRPAHRQCHGRRHRHGRRSQRAGTDRTGRSLAKPTTPEEKHEYDANEGRCKDDGGTVRNVGTMDAYCAFPVRSNDFHLIETAQQKELAGEEE